MSGSSLELQRAGETELSYVETLLERNDLPSQDVRSKPECFYVGYDGGDPVGIGGIESYSPDGLLRSVVVDRTVRENGIGTALCNALETEARARDVETLYLLTTTAATFFATCGYREIERSAAPASIRQTTEFSDLCPTEADCLKKSL